MRRIFLPVLSSSCHWNKEIKICAFVLVIFTSNIASLFGQSAEIEIIRDQIKNDEFDEYATVYMNLFVEFSGLDLDSAMKYARLAEKAAFTEDNSLEYVRAKYALGWTYKSLSMYDTAIYHYKEGIQVAKKYLENEDMFKRYKSILNGLGLAYYYQGNYDSSLVYHFESLNTRNQELIDIEGLTDKSALYDEIAISENNIGLVYIKIKDYNEAINYFNRAIDNKLKAGNYDIESNQVNLGLSYVYSFEDIQDEKFMEAVRVFSQVLDSCSIKKTCESGILYETYNALGILSLNSDSITKARNYFELALQYAEEENDLGKRLHVLHNIANVYQESGNYSDAIDILNRGQKWTDSLNIPPLRAENFKMLASAHEKAGMHQLAYDYLKKYDSLRSQILSDELINGIKNVLVAQNEKTNQKKISQQNEEISAFQTAQLYLIIIVILAFIILFIVIYNNQQRQKVNRKLSNANKTIEEKNVQLQNVNVSLEEKVRERTKELKKANEALKQSNLELDNFIYKTSHDIRGPLATLQGICNVALLDVQDEKAIDYLDKLNGTATKLNEILSKLLIINQINNSVISQSPIPLEEIVQQIISDNVNRAQEKHIETRVKIEGKLFFKSDEDLIRIIIGNLVNNAYKFYKKSYSVQSFVGINILKNNLFLVIEVIDNGVGIDDKAHNKIFEIFSKATEMSDSAGLGLYLVKLSVEKLHGTIKLSRTIEGYTKFKVMIPYQSNG